MLIRVQALGSKTRRQVVKTWVVLQSWRGGLENFLSNAPADGAVEDVAETLTATSNGGEIIVRTMNATAIPKHGPSLGMYPSYLTFDPDHHERELSYL